MMACKYDCEACVQRGRCFAIHRQGRHIVIETIEPMFVDCLLPGQIPYQRYWPSVCYASACEVEPEEAQEYDGESLVRERESRDWNRRENAL